MKNSELLNYRGLLTNIDRQKLTIMKIHLTSCPCPNCQMPINVYDAGGFTLDEDDFGATERQYACPNCGRRLEYVVPFISVEPYRWLLVSELKALNLKPGDKVRISARVWLDADVPPTEPVPCVVQSVTQVGRVFVMPEELRLNTKCVFRGEIIEG